MGGIEYEFRKCRNSLGINAATEFGDHRSEGVAIGTKAFVNEVFTLHRDKFGPKRKDGARPIRALSCIGLTALRDLRVRAFG